MASQMSSNRGAGADISMVDSPNIHHSRRQGAVSMNPRVKEVFVDVRSIGPQSQELAR